ncbi:MAG TPA: glutathione S-transferase, partial [Pseudomonas sp.]|nr:glutathione S-transferase [Pseudomonas sp.]
VSSQLLAAYALLEKQLPDSEALTQASITAAVAWSFSQFTVASVVRADAFPNLKRHAERLEEHPAFRKYPIE